ncbi:MULTISPECIES: hypothetical protein [Paenibacillus]|uniref:hypothetical protein n=1 Tax=Paenibacillus TaxID=44249 RepID=UPI001582BED1|nr:MULTISPECIES: hypothetical protein [Paenibacillus]MDU0330812.1 hypothetical protein [Paenibacillus sp. 3LSP]
MKVCSAIGIKSLPFFSVKTKSSHASSDNFSIYGKYVYLENGDCNHSITDTGALERFLL